MFEHRNRQTHTHVRRPYIEGPCCRQGPVRSPSVLSHPPRVSSPRQGDISTKGDSESTTVAKILNEAIKKKVMEQNLKDPRNKAVVEAMSTKNQLLQKQVEKLLKQLEDKKNEATTLEHEFKKLQTDHKDVSDYVDEWTDDKAKLEAKITQLQAQLKSASKQTDEVTKLEMALAVAEKDRDNAKRQVLDLTIRLRQLEAFKETKSAPGDQMPSKHKEIEKLTTRVTKLHMAVAVAEKDRDNAKQQASDLTIRLSQLEAFKETKSAPGDEMSSKQKEIEKLTTQVAKLQVEVKVAKKQRDQQMGHAKRLILEKKKLAETLEKTIEKLILGPVEGSPDPKTQPHLHAIHFRMAQLFDKVTKVDEMVTNVELYRNHYVERTGKLGRDIKMLENKLEDVKSMKNKPRNGGAQTKKRLDVYSSYLQRTYGLTPLS